MFLRLLFSSDHRPSASAALAAAHAASAAGARPSTVSRERLREMGTAALLHPSTPGGAQLQHQQHLQPLQHFSFGADGAAGAGAGGYGGDDEYGGDGGMNALDLIRRADRGGGVNKRTLLMALTCPLSRQIMIDPVVAEDGFSYERRAITAYVFGL
jgi:hypothetical protein